MNKVKHIETIDFLTINPMRKGFPGCLKFWLPKYISRSIRVHVKSSGKEIV
ncbi:hypothetical protein SAMN04487770_13654 [Butyrivibrio sp. ob235]|uniref:hypothetical protein n=1 Tax=Butyrivibrio sp. ob235 TaxID=1761780 RepID=UPI0008ACB346|nr:hypothetical protein [Butyrivibrio sp. ob235]SEM39561.1 hypothetical protein SAMN04487770_13654 [Butyrivibrio sp. ob235]